MNTVKLKPVTTRSHIPDFIVWGAFAAIVGITILNHIMWRDEWQAILLGYKSNSWSNLGRATRDEGHPMLWFVLLYVAKFLGPATVIPKIFQYISALAYCGIILFYAPFPRIVRYTLVFTYFLVFEYAVITRDYGIGVLLIVSIMALWQNRRRHSWLFALLIFLLAQATFYSTIMAGVFVLILLSEPLLLKSKWQLNTKDLLFIIAGIAGVIISYQTCSRLPTLIKLHLFFNPQHLALVIDNIYNSYFPIPEFTHNCWNTIVPDSDNLRAFLSIIIIAGIVYFLRADKRAIVFFIAYLIAHELFSYFYLLGFMRHSGYLFIAGVVAFWFYYLRYPRPVFKPAQKIIIGGVLAVQVFVGLYFIQDNLTEPFSEDAETAAWIHNNHLDRLPMYGNVIYCTTGITGNLDKPIIDVNNLKPYYYVPWSEITFPVTDSMLQVHYSQILSAQDSAVLILDYTSPFIAQKLEQDNTHIIPLSEFTNSNSEDENFYVFLLKR